MKKSSIQHQGEKLLFGGVTAIGLFMLNAKIVKADDVVLEEMAQKSPNKGGTSTAPELNASTNEASNDTATNTGAAKSTATDSAAAVAPAKSNKLTRSVVNTSWNGLQVAYDDVSGILTIPGGTASNPVVLTNPDPMGGYVPGIYTPDIKQVKLIGQFKLIGSVDRLFAALNSATSITGLANVDTSDVTDMFNMFANCNSLEDIDVSHFDTSKVTNMGQMFFACHNLKKADVSHWDTSKVTNMSFMFDLNYISDGTIHRTKLTELDVSHFDTSQVTDMSQMFAGCTELKKLDVSHFDTSKVTNMHDMFGDCHDLTELDVTGFDTSKVTNVGAMFSGCASLEELDLSKFDMTSISSYGKPAMGYKDQTTVGMLSAMPKLKILKLSPKCDVKNAELYSWYYLEDAPVMLNPNSKWVGLAGGKLTDAKGPNVWTPEELVNEYRLGTDADTYIRSGQLIAHYQDESGQTLVPTRTIRGLIDKNYDTADYQATIPGYTLKEVQGDPARKFEEGNDKEITFVYTKLLMPTPTATVTVHYQDEGGQTVAPDEVLNGPIGAAYQSTQKVIPGYTFKEVRGDAKGYFAANPQTVSWVYRKDQLNSPISPTFPVNPVTPSGPGNPVSPNDIVSAVNPSVPALPSNSSQDDPGKEPSTGKHGSTTKSAKDPRNIFLKANDPMTNKVSAKSDQSSKTLPKTGNNQKLSIATLTLGGVLVIIALCGAWVSRKHRSNQ
ncbi:BspA family leucine-rich repeat surface protein [Lactobacillus xylocopicola]|nr:BspA family leucine-rich repeat surface protein [Lactobacillus xylocopicola]